MKPPCKVFAILNSTDTTVFMLGFGDYVGDEVPPPEIKFCGIPVRRPNPKIILHSGQVVWGCECWFGDAERYQEFTKGKTVMHTDIVRARQRSRQARDNFDPED